MSRLTIGIDIAKNVFQVHGVDAAGQVVIMQKLRRTQLLSYFTKLDPCLIGIEACASSHHWARELTAMGHEVKLMSPSYVKRGKNDMVDAEAICEAVTRPNMRFVPIKMASQQSILMVHRSLASASSPPPLSPQPSRILRHSDRDAHLQHGWV